MCVKNLDPSPTNKKEKKMTAAAPKIITRPDGWPTDSRSWKHTLDGQTFIYHPERKPHLYDEKLQKWREVS